MPATLTYPGVYVEEVPSGVHTITGVPTSITAFIGRAVSGPIDSDDDSPVTINGFADFERIFGGLDRKFPLSYTVRDFFQNGGGKAVVVRVYKEESGKPARAILSVNGLSLEAANPGAWGNSLKIRIDSKVSSDVANRYGLTGGDLFNLTIYDSNTERTEKFLNLTVKDSPNRADVVLKNRSNLVRTQSSAWPPANVPAAHADPPNGKSVWDDSNSPPTFTKVATADEATDGGPLDFNAYLGDQNTKTGLYALEKEDLFNLLCIPEDSLGAGLNAAVYSPALDYCVQRRAMLIVDPPVDWSSANDITANNEAKLTALNLSGDRARNAVLYFPRLLLLDPNLNGQPDSFVPCGAAAGVMARTDAQRGVWKSAAGIDASLNGVQGLEVPLTDAENGMLNPLGINCFRTFPVFGSIIWGARTLRGADVAADEYKYSAVRRTALFIQESLFRGTKWIVFQENDEPLWGQIRLNVGAFMHDLFRQGAFQGKTPKEAYLVKCDKETTTQNDIDHGIVNILVGFAPLKPAEFVVLRIQQLAGQIQT